VFLRLKCAAADIGAALMARDQCCDYSPSFRARTSYMDASGVYASIETLLCECAIKSSLGRRPKYWR